MVEELERLGNGAEGQEFDSLFGQFATGKLSLSVHQ